jgi:trk system potassium uptake protein TrkA
VIDLRKQFAVIGLGRFGGSLAATLSRLGSEVMAVDVNEDRVREIAQLVTTAVQADATQEGTLRDLGMKNFDVIVVAMSAFEASLMVTLLLKQMGCKQVIVKASSDQHGQILEKVGADRVVFPEKDMGERLGFSLISGSLIDHIELSPEYSVFEIEVAGALAKRSLRSLDLRHKAGINVVALKRGDSVQVFIDPDELLREGDALVAIGSESGLRKLSDMIDRG